MRGFRYPGVLAALILLLAAGADGAEWVDLNRGGPAEPTHTVTAAEPDRVVVRVEVAGFYTETIDIEGRAHARILMPGAAPLLKRGLPQLPLLARSVIVGDAGEVSVRVLHSSWREFPTAPVEPSKGDLPRTVDPATVPYVFDDFYTTGGVFPDAAAVMAQPYLLRDHRGAALHVHPVRYDAGRNLLLVLETLTCEIVTAGAGGANVKIRAPGGQPDPQFQRLYASHFLNAPADKYAAISNPGPMLIVAHDPFLGRLDEFAAWKRQRGIPVELVGVSELGGTTAGIQNAINARYQSAAGLTYVILVGDLAQIPTYGGTVESYADCDARYAMVAGADSYPDLFVSRISAQTSTQVDIQIAKFLRYEREPEQDGGWYSQATGIASNETGGTGIYDWQRADALRDALLGYTFTHVDRLYEDYGGTTAGISAALNEGRSLVNYIGHGSGTSWTSVPFSNTNVHALANGWRQPWIVDVSCANGDFSMSECFAEAWLRTGTVEQPKGAVGIYSASTNTSWVPPCVMQDEVIDLLVADVENSLGALYFSGAMKALDTYPTGTEGRKLVEQYNIFGDCSLIVRTTAPAALAPLHDQVMALQAPAFAVATPGLEGATATLTLGGELLGAARTGADGLAVIELAAPVTSPCELTLTVTAYNHAPYTAAILAIVPASVAIEPASLPIGVLTAVTVTVTDTLGIGLPDLDVWIEGYGVAGLHQTTGADGVAAFTVTPLYGEVLRVRGREPGAAYNLFTADLPVEGAEPLAGAAISASTPGVPLAGQLTPHLAGLVSGVASSAGLTLFLRGCGLDTVASVDGELIEIEATPLVTGEVAAVLAQPGAELHAAAIPVVAVHGRLAGIVTALDGGGAPLGGVRVTAHQAGADPAATPPLFDLLTDAQGSWAAPDSLPVGYYDLRLAKFGYLPLADAIFLDFGQNDLLHALPTAPRGELAGTVTRAGDGAPLTATIKLFRADTQELYAQTASDSLLAGAYSLPDLPLFDYRIEVRAERHIGQVATVAVDEALVELDFVLEGTAGAILVIDDDGVRSHPAKLDKSGAVIGEAFISTGERSASIMAADLTALGYTVTIENVASTNPSAWPNYDLLVVACGDNTSTLTSATFRSQLAAHVAGGGHLLVEGGEVAYNRRNDTAFLRDVLRVASWTHDSSGNVTVTAPDHHVMSVPNVINGPLTLTYANYGDADAVTVASGAQRVGGWTSYPTDASIVVHDSNPAPQGGQFVFFTFDYKALAPAARPLLLENAARWLVTPEHGEGRISGRAHLPGADSDAGITVLLHPLGRTVVTAEDGAFDFPDLFAGAYQLIATKSGHASAIRDIALAEAQQATGLLLSLAPIITSEFLSSPEVVIPDNDSTTGVTSTLEIAVTAPITTIEVYVEITHTFIGDLTIDLISPAGTNVRLHSNAGAGDDDIIGWYPTTLTPAQSLSVLNGQNPAGVWRLRVRDWGPMDVGILHAWGLKLAHPAEVTGVEDGAGPPRSLALAGAVPNPFNPRTEISFALPQAAKVELAVYDLRGRRVAVLAAGVLAAGWHSAVWDGANAAGERAASGLYVYRLRAGGETLTRKMMMVK